jgi:hypothetical protein
MDRRTFLADTGMGFTGLALSAMLARDGYSSENKLQPQTGRTHFTPKAKNVIWLFMGGGVSHMESFDPKPALNKYAGRLASETPLGDVFDTPFFKENYRKFALGERGLNLRMYPMQVGFRKRGRSGIEICDWWKHLGDCVDDMAIIRSMWTTDLNHSAQAQFHTGRHVIDGCHPSIGSWVSYGLGTRNDNLPQYITMGYRVHYGCGAHQAEYLGPEHDGVAINLDSKNPLPYGRPERELPQKDQRLQFDLLNKLNRLTALEYPRDAKLSARIKSYELAFGMQRALPDALDFRYETQDAQQLYGLDRAETREFGSQCLAARRLVERGVRFVQLFNGCEGAGEWDAHDFLQRNHARKIRETDKPIAGLLKDLKRRGMLDDTLVVWGTEFGRTPGLETERQVREGREHHPFGFSVWMAGGGIKGGIAHGATDELGFHAIENRHYVTDLHATVLHQLGLDPRRLTIPGRKRLEIDAGDPIREIIA